MGGLFRALLICSDDGCAELFEAYGSLDELEALACDCGCALQLMSVSEVEFEEPVLWYELPRAA